MLNAHVLVPVDGLGELVISNALVRVRKLLAVIDGHSQPMNESRGALNDGVDSPSYLIFNVMSSPSAAPLGTTINAKLRMIPEVPTALDRRVEVPDGLSVTNSRIGGIRIRLGETGIGNVNVS